MSEAILYIEEETETLITVVFMAMFGGLVNWLRQKKPKNFSQLVACICTAAFSGLLVYYLTSAMGFSEQTQCAMSGIAGYGGGTLLDDEVKKLKSLLNTNRKTQGILDSENENKNNK